MELPINQIVQGDTLAVLKTFPDDCIDCVITSPPYYGLRDYGTAIWEGGDVQCDHETPRSRGDDLKQNDKQAGVRGSRPNTQTECICGAKRIDQQIGLEKTLNEYLEKMLAITAELKRVLKPSGTMWWNHGTNYGGAISSPNAPKLGNRADDRIYSRPPIGIEKCDTMQNYRLAIRMCDEQKWTLRNIVIWNKPNVMPSSVKDRFTVDYEPVFFFTKAKRYWFEPQYEPNAEVSIKSRSAVLNQTTHSGAKMSAVNVQTGNEGRGTRFIPLLGRNKRSVWRIPTHPYPDAHFATFPPALIETPIKAGCPEFICTKCGKAREAIFEPSEEYKKSLDKIKGLEAGNLSKGYANYKSRTETLTADYKKTGYTDCKCNAPFVGGIVLDPFMGSGTTALMAKHLGRRYIGIELNKDYIKLAEDRLRQDVLF